MKYYYLMFLGTKGWAYVCNEGGCGTKRFSTVEEASAYGRKIQKSVKVMGVK